MSGFHFALLAMIALLPAFCAHAAPTTSPSSARIAPIDLRCEYRVDPLGIDSPAPQLSWTLRATDPAARGLHQAAYQVLVASSPTLLAKDRGDLWDSGKVSSDDNQLAYAGVPLHTDQRAFWKVRVWDGEQSATSEPAHWSMGVLAADDWKAKWITAPDAGSDTSTALFRGEFAATNQVTRATLSICGLGQYDATLNGQPVTSDLLTPGWTQYERTCLYDTYDVTALVREGANAIGVLLGNGMYRVKKERYAKFERSFGPLRVIARLRLEYADGSNELVGTDDRWRSGPSPMTFSSVYGGEDWDARLVQNGWDQPGFDASNWKPVKITEGPGGALKGTSRSSPPVRGYQVHTPIAQREIKPGTIVYDLGQTASQMPRVTALGPAGSVVKITPSELLRPDGTVFRNNYNGKSWCEFTLAGTGVESWRSRFYYSGFRYLQVECIAASGSSELPRVESIDAVVVHSSVERAGEFTCSNPLFNQIDEMVRWAELGNMMSVISDCPHRERLGWLEQSHLHGPSFWYGYDMRPLFTKIIGDMADCQEPSGLIPTCVPDYPKFPPRWREAIEWGSAGVLIPWQQYQFTGELDVLRRNYPMMKAYAAYVAGRSKDHIAPAGLGDWSGRGPSPETPKELLTTALQFENVTALAKSARLLGLEEDAAAHEQLAQSIRSAFNAEFFDPQTNRYATGSQAAHGMALALGLVEDQHRDAVLAALITDIESRKHALTVGEVGLPYLQRALADAGRSDVLFAMHSQSEQPGYAYQLKQGATALPETWDAYRDNSQIQFMLGHIVEWFYRDVAGIGLDPSRPGFGHVIIRPSIVGDLQHAKASYRSMRGTITSAWSREGNQLTLRVTLPPGVTATVHIPTADAAFITETNQPLARSQHAGLTTSRDGVATVEINSGAYTFESQLPQ